MQIWIFLLYFALRNQNSNRMSNDTLSFSVSLATTLGLEQSIVLSVLRTWHNYNKYSPTLVRNGYVWCPCSKKQLNEAMPFLSDRVIRSTIEKMTEQGILIMEETMDKTHWLAFTPIGLQMFEGGNVTVAKPEPVPTKTYSVEEKRQMLRDKCIPYIPQYGQAMIDAFVDYWGEADGNTLRCEFAKRKSGAFEIGRRLATWASNNYGNTPQPAQPTRPKKEIWEELGLTKEQYLEMHKK